MDLLFEGTIFLRDFFKFTFVRYLVENGDLPTQHVFLGLLFFLLYT